MLYATLFKFFKLNKDYTKGRFNARVNFPEYANMNTTIQNNEVINV
jgi:hypothetical protein